MSRRFGNTTLELVLGDITTFPVEAIVNAANSRLAGGGGVDGAIHRAGGPEIMKACRKIGGCPTGEAVATPAGALPAKWVIHTVGPVYRDGRHGEAELLAAAYRNSLRLSRELGATSISFPSLSTGAYHYPLDEAASIALSTVREELSQESGSLERVLFVLFDERTLRAYEGALSRLEGPAR